MPQPQFGSRCVHEHKGKRTTTRPHQLPIYATSSFEFENINEGIDIFTGQKAGHVYGRYANPTVDAVAAKIADLECFGLEQEAGCLLTSSGMSAISTLMMSVVGAGDKVLTQGNLYGGSTELLTKVFAPMGVETVFTNLQDLDQVEELLKADSSIRLLYFETPANPTMTCVDLEALAALAKKYDCKSAVDNTFCTPYLQQPFRWGVDFVVHSTTKYLNGHGNSIAGAILATDKDFLKKEIWTRLKLAGTNCSPFEAWLINNGIKTLELRMDRHCTNAMTIATFLDKHPKVARVNYNGLPSHPDHQLAKKQMSQFGGMMSFELHGGLQAGIDCMNQIQFCVLAPTLGDVDTLILHPASSSHLNVPKKIRERNGITDGLIRLSVGIENVEDIIDDLEQAMA